MRKLFFLFIAVLFLNITQAQYVGIGTTIPDTKLVVQDAAFEQLKLYNPNNAFATQAGMYLQTASGWNVELRTMQDSSYLEIFGAGAVKHRWNDVNYYPGNGTAFITGSGSNISMMDGYIGIGTTTPTVKLHVVENFLAPALLLESAGVPTLIINNSASNAAGIKFTVNNVLKSQIQSNPSGDLDLFSGGSHMKMKNDGTVGFGTFVPQAALDVSSTTNGFLPPRMTQGQRDLIVSPVEGLIIYNSTTKRPNYYNGINWMSYDASFPYKIGDSFQGGIIAYILQPGDPGYDPNVPHGLIAAASDQSTGAQWGCNGTSIPGAQGIVIGTGNQNTIYIMAGCATAGIAARICGDLVLNGYSDWYLPSIDELNKLYLNKAAIGGFITNSYWSSSEYNVLPWSGAWFLVFWSGEQGTNANKDYPFCVRAVRSF